MLRCASLTETGDLVMHSRNSRASAALLAAA